MKKKNVVPVILMASSIVLLLLLQGLWLLNSYDKAYNDLRRQTSDIFRSTLITMRDSIFMKGMDATSISISGGTPQIPEGAKAIFFSLSKDSSNQLQKKQRQVRSQEMLSRTEILVRGALPDSVRTKLSSFSNAHVLQDGGKVVIRFAPDSLKADTVNYFYRLALAKENIFLPFKVRVDRPEMPMMDGQMTPQMLRRAREHALDGTESVPHNKSEIITEWFRFAPTLRYASVFGNVHPYLIKQIAPQITFALALTLITSAAFIIMYRGIRTQQKLMELKNDFISNITHELKTPVTTVSVALEALRNFKALENPQTTKEYLDIAQSELNRLSLLTDKVLKTAVFDHRGVNFEKEEVDLRTTVEQILHSMKLIFEKQKAQVTFEQEGNSFMISGGSVHLTNVVYNLLDNALKYGGANPEISVRLEEEGNKVILKISDKGIGIPAEYKKKIFEKFFRVPTGDVHNIKGYGLGLSYVDSVIRSHRGVIEVTSKPGEGSMFTISLPKG